MYEMYHDIGLVVKRDQVVQPQCSPVWNRCKYPVGTEWLGYRAMEMCVFSC